MFQFHGWIKIVADGWDPEILASTLFQEMTVTRLNEIIGKHSDAFSIFEARVTGNNMVMVLVHGLRNHRSEEVFRLFTEIGEKFPKSYGLLYAQDDESENYNEFRVFRLARGELKEFADPFLSPCIPGIEDEYSVGND